MPAARPLTGERLPLVLAPSDRRGWFGGPPLVACDPVEARAGVSLADAAEALQEAFEGRAGIVAVLAPYEGACTVVRYAGASEESATAGVGASVATPLLANAAWDTTRDTYLAAVETARELIAAGDVYVVNLTAQLTGDLSLAPAAAFDVLRARASSAMDATFEGWPGDTSWIASVSPERFCRITRTADGSRMAEIAPIKGTAPRGSTAEEDARNAAKLLADPKERAEHVMVVDLERNDLGMVCEPGSVHVDPLYQVVATPYCHQLVSSVRGTLRPDASFAELLAAVHPCGSITGAPKRAAMCVISELEASPRGSYCGALLVAQPGELDSSILIRTLADVGEGRAMWGAGCGITYESDAEAEYCELLLKATPVTG